VVGVEDEQDVQGPGQARVGLVLDLRHLEQHREEVLRIGEVVVRIDVRQPQVVPVGEGRQRRHLGDHPDRRHVALLGVVDVLRVGVEGGERPDGGEQHPHRVGVVAEALDELLDVLVHEGVVGDVVDPPFELLLGGELAEDEQVGHLEIGRLLAQLLDRNPPVLEDPRLAVDVGDRRAAGSRVGERRVVGHQAEVLVGDLDLAQIDGPDRAVADLQLVGLARAVVGDAQAAVGARALGPRRLLGLLLGRHQPSP
jgi:hypothetical protein